MIRTERVEQYLTAGVWMTRTPRARDDIVVKATPAQVVAAVRALPGGTPIPERYFLGTAQHESGWALNERDTEPNGKTTWGIYQMDDDERRAAAMGPEMERLLELGPATYCLAKNAEWRRGCLRHALLLEASAPDPIDLGAYLVIAHNEGLGAALKTVRLHGLNWRKYKDRNITEAAARLTDTVGELEQMRAQARFAHVRQLSVYGDDCL